MAIFVIALVFRLVFVLRYPGRTMGIDAYYHLYVSRMLLHLGGVPEVNPYHYYGAPHDYPPFFHMVLMPVVKISEAMDCSPITLSLLLTAFLGAITAVAMYYVGRSMCDVNVGILAGLFFALTSSDLVFASFIRPDNLVFLFMALILLFVIQYENSKKCVFLFLACCIFGLHIFTHASWLLTLTVLSIYTLALFLLFKDDKSSLKLFSVLVGGVLLGFLLYKVFAPFMIDKNMGLTYLLQGLSKPFQVAGQSRSIAFEPLTLSGLLVRYNVALPVLAVFGIPNLVRQINHRTHVFLLTFFVVLLYPTIFEGHRYVNYLEIPAVVVASIGFHEAYKIAKNLKNDNMVYEQTILGLLVGLLLCSYGFGLASAYQSKPFIPLGLETTVEEAATIFGGGKAFSMWDIGHLLAYYGFPTFNDGYPSVANSQTYDKLMSRILFTSNNQLELLESINAEIVVLEPQRYETKNLITKLDQTTRYDKVGIGWIISHRLGTVHIYHRTNKKLE